MYNNDGYEALENLLSAKKNADNYIRTLEILNRISTECLNPFTTSTELYSLVEQAQNLCPALADFSEWMIAKAAIKEKNLHILTSQVEACIKKLNSININ